MMSPKIVLSFFFFNDTATTEIYTLSLHDALPIFRVASSAAGTRHAQENSRSSWCGRRGSGGSSVLMTHQNRDRKSTRLNSSHANISYAVFCLKKKNKKIVGVRVARANRGCMWHTR